MKSRTMISLISTMIALGLGGTTANAQPAPVVTIPPPASPLRVEPLNPDESELEQAVIEGQSGGGLRTEWAIAPPPAAEPARVSAPPRTAAAPSAFSPAELTPPPATASSLPYLSGGVGYDERARMEAMKSQYNLRLLFAISGAGSYLSGVKVRIQDIAGTTLLDAISNGPWLYAQLAPGNYVLTLDHEGQIQRRNITITPGRATVENVYWTGPMGTMPMPPGTGGSFVEPPAYGPSPTVPPIQPMMTSNGIAYITGGSDPGERARIEAAQSQFNMRLLFTIDDASSKPFLLHVRVQDPSGQRTWFEADASGPLFYAKVPPGDYLVSVKYGGSEHQQPMKIPGSGAATASLKWTK